MHSSRGILPERPRVGATETGSAHIATAFRRRIRRWIADDLGYTGLDKQTSNFLIAVYALLDDRAWVFHSGPEKGAPDLMAIGHGWALRSQPLPGKDAYEAARDQAARLFGIPAEPNPYARNVNKLAEDVRAGAETFERAVQGVRTTLDRRATLLGLDGTGPAPRAVVLREAAGLLARLGRHATDATALVEELAASTTSPPSASSRAC